MDLTEKKKRELAKLPTGNVADSNTAPNGVMDAGIKPVDPACHLVGRAFTAQCRPGDNLALHQAIDAAGPGDVLVLDCGGYTGGGHLGDMMATACKAKGIAGVVIDGSCRDSRDILALGLPVFCRGFCPAGTTKESLGILGVPVVVGGVCVRPGDVVFGDGDGVVVVPREDEDAVFAKALAKYEKEQGIREQLLAGQPPLEIFGLEERIREKQRKL